MIKFKLFPLFVLIKMDDRVMRFFAPIALVILFNAFQCTQEPQKPMPAQSIEQVLAAYTDSLMSIKGVVGVGQSLCDGKPCIKVFISEDSKEIKSKIPKSLDGYPVSVEVSGEFKAR